MRLLKKLNKVTMVLVFALLITSVPSVGTVNKVEAATTAGNVVYEGNGSLSCGSATLKLENAVLTYTGSTTIKYWNNPVAGTMVINQTDRLAHVFWYSGIYFVIDMNNGRKIQAYKNSNNQYCLDYMGHAVKGDSAYMALINTVLIDDKWFYQENSGVERLMTREEFDKIINNQDPTAPTPVPTVAPTATPTATPTVAPTVAPTATPTATPTVAPTVASTATPTVAPTATPVPDTKIDFDFEFWWKQYTSGTITWEQFTKIVWENKWTVDSQATEKETTYYFYDDAGKLIRTERVLVSNSSSTGTGNGSANVDNNGKADVDIKNEGNGGGSGTITIINKKPSNTSSSSKGKTTYHVKRNGKYVYLSRTTASGKTGIICKVYYNKSKKYVKFDGIPYRKISYVGYTSSSRMIILRTTSGKEKIIPRAKGKIGKTYVAKTLKGKWKKNIEDVRGLCMRVSDGKKKVMGVKNAQPKKIKR